MVTTNPEPQPEGSLQSTDGVARFCVLNKMRQDVDKYQRTQKGNEVFFRMTLVCDLVKLRFRPTHELDELVCEEQ